MTARRTHVLTDSIIYLIFFKYYLITIVDEIQTLGLHPHLIFFPGMVSFPLFFSVCCFSVDGRLTCPGSLSFPEWMCEALRFWKDNFCYTRNCNLKLSRASSKLGPTHRRTELISFPVVRHHPLRLTYYYTRDDLMMESILKRDTKTGQKRIFPPTSAPFFLPPDIRLVGMKDD